MTENVVDTNAAPYKESDEFVPDPTAVFGTLETSGTAGGDNEKAEKMTPIFDAAKANDLAYAKRAVDPDDADVSEGEAVVLPNGDRTAEEAREAVRRAAQAFEKEPVKVEDPSLLDAERDNEDKQKSSPVERAAKVEGQQQQASAVGGTARGSDDASQRLQAGEANKGTQSTAKAQAEGK